MKAPKWYLIRCREVDAQVTVQAFDSRDLASAQAIGKHKWVVGTLEELQAAAIPGHVLVKTLHVCGHGRADAKFKNRTSTERKVWRAMSDKQKADEAKKKADEAKKKADAAAEAKKAEETKKAQKAEADAKKKAAAEAAAATKKAEAEAKKAQKAEADAKKKAEAEAKKQEREAARSRINHAEAIHLLVGKNPKREGSEAFKRFALYRNGMTVDEFLKAGGTMADINWDLGRRLIELRKAAHTHQA